ncbi:MAG TPA: hypothetical protein VF653_03385 [Methylomirabilota bacterium]
MKCAFGHRHPPLRVVGLVPYPEFSGRVGPRVYHCADCAALGSDPADWDKQEFENPKAARRAGQSTACPVCFPPVVARMNAEWLVTCSCGWRVVTSPFQRARVTAFVHSGRTPARDEKRHACRVVRLQ